MPKVIKIRIENPDALRINFVMTRSCPYSCRYCPETLNAGKHQPINLKDFKTFLLKFKDRPCAVMLSGGECTTHPQFKDAIKTVKDVGFNVAVDSNSVRTFRFYNDVKDLVDNWCITLHPSQHKKLDLDILKLLAESSFLVVYVMMDPEHWTTSLNWLEKISSLTNLKLTPIRIMDDWGGANFKANYTDEQLDFLSRAESKWLFTEERESALRKTHMWLADTESYASYDNGVEEKLDVFDLIRKKQNNFFGWNCSAGKESICIYEDGTATWANCGIKNYKHYLDINPIDLDQSVKCTFIECTCGTDIRGTKSLN